MTTGIATQAYSRLDPDASARLRRAAAAAQPTPGQKTVEYTLFGVFGVTIALAAVALYAINSPEHQLVPNAFEDGIRGGRANVLIIETTTPQSQSRTTRIESLTVVSIKGDTHEAALISLPPNMWVKVGRYGTHRLASAAAIGNSSGYPGEGAGLTVDTVSEMMGQPIHSYIRLEKSRLRETIAALGGISVTPRPGRDPHTRELRQQEVLAAVFTKLQTSGPQVRQQLLLPAHGEPMSNMTADQLARFVSSFGNASSLRHVSLRPLLDPFEVQTLGDERGQALRPKTGDFAEVQKAAREVFAERGAATASLTH